MTTFLALYSGKDIEHAELVAISANERLIQDFAQRLTEKEPEVRQYIEEQSPDSSSSKVA